MDVNFTEPNFNIKRRGTMEEADVLYGVTMQEHGVSQVMRLDLSEAEKTIKA